MYAYVHRFTTYMLPISDMLENCVCLASWAENRTSLKLHICIMLSIRNCFCFLWFAFAVAWIVVVVVVSLLVSQAHNDSFGGTNILPLALLNS